MHEYSVVSALLEQCERYAAENEAQKVLKLKVHIGVQSGVEVGLFESAFEMFKQDTICDGAKLDIESIKIGAKCEDCECEFEPIGYDFVCPKCSGINAKIIRGKELHLISLEME